MKRPLGARWQLSHTFYSRAVRPWSLGLALFGWFRGDCFVILHPVCGSIDLICGQATVTLSVWVSVGDLTVVCHLFLC